MFNSLPIPWTTCFSIQGLYREPCILCVLYQTAYRSFEPQQWEELRTGPLWSLGVWLLLHLEHRETGLGFRWQRDNIIERYTRIQMQYLGGRTSKKKIFYFLPTLESVVCLHSRSIIFASFYSLILSSFFLLLSFSLLLPLLVTYSFSHIPLFFLLLWFSHHLSIFLSPFPLASYSYCVSFFPATFLYALLSLV